MIVSKVPGEDPPSPPENPQKCCTGQRISLPADDNGDSHASPFLPASLSFTLCQLQGGLNPTGGVKIVRKPITEMASPLAPNLVSGPIRWEERGFKLYAKLISGWTQTLYYLKHEVCSSHGTCLGFHPGAKKKHSIQHRENNITAFCLCYSECSTFSEMVTM